MQETAEAQALTATELSVLIALIKHRRVTRVALELERKEGTVRVHIRNIHRKAGTSSIPDLLMWALENRPWGARAS
ncbi:MAG: LuxR C-terminal-related transcriptional regulator [Tepidiformaceae bacterium]